MPTLDFAYHLIRALALPSTLAPTARLPIVSAIAMSADVVHGSSQAAGGMDGGDGSDGGGSPYEPDHDAPDAWTFEEWLERMERWTTEAEIREYRI